MESVKRSDLQVAIEQLFQTEMPRRSVFLLALAALSGSIIPSSSQEAPKPPKKRLLRAINSLPESPIKSLLADRTFLYYQDQPPKSVNISGVDFKIRAPTIVIETSNQTEVGGSYIPRAEGLPPSEALYPVAEEVIKIPYLGLLLESERQNFLQDNLAQDQTPFVYIRFPTNIPLYEGFNHKITIVTPNPNLIKPDSRVEYAAYEEFGFIKEASGLLLDDIWIKEVIKKMQELGWPTHIQARKSDGSVVQTEIIIQSLHIITLNNGRFLAARDLASYLIAFKAVWGTWVFRELPKDPKFAQVLPGIKDVNLGDSENEILYNSFKWAITSPVAQGLVHIGSIKKLP